MPFQQESVAGVGSSIAYWSLDLSEPWAGSAARTIVFQHGLGLNSLVWTPWIPVLPAGSAIISIDLRGHGRSQGAWVKNDYSIDELTDDVLAVLDQASVEKCHYIGESIGGTIGLNLAARCPDRVASVSVCSTAFRGALVSNVAAWPELAGRDGIGAWSDDFLRGRFPSDGIDERLREWVDAIQRQLHPRVVGGIVRSLLATDLSSALTRMTTPVLAIFPAGSPFVNPQNAVALKEMMPFADTAFIRAARHGVVLSHWRECADLAADFILRTEAQNR